MGQGLVEIRPHVLVFAFEVKKESSCVVQLINKSSVYVAFKVKTTCPNRYSVYPHTGVILPWKTFEFTVIMQGLLHAPPSMQLRDKFLVQTTVVPHGTSDKQLVPAFFSKESGRYTEERIFGVVLVSAHQSLEGQTTNGIHETESAMTNKENKVRDVANEAPAPLATEDVQHLKSKLNNIESKLEECFCLLYVVFVALLCILLGYLLGQSSELRMLRMWQEN